MGISMQITPLNIKYNSNLINGKNKSPSFTGSSVDEDAYRKKLELFQIYETNLKKAEIQIKLSSVSLALLKFQDCMKKYEKGNVQEALKIYEESFAILQKYKASSDFYSDYFSIGGDLYQESGNLGKAESFYSMALANVDENSKNADVESNSILNKIARNYILQGKQNIANEILEQLFEEVKTPKELVDIILSKLLIGDGEKENLTGTINYLNTLENVNSLEPNFYLQHMTALLYRDQNEFEYSNLKASEMISGLDSKGDNNSTKYVETVSLMGSNYYDLFKKNRINDCLDKSLQCYKKALRIVEDNQYKSLKNSILLSIGQIYFDKQDFEKSESFLSQITSEADFDTTKRCLELLSDIAVENKEYKKAVEYLDTIKKMKIANGDNFESVASLIEKLYAVSKLSDDAKKMQQYSEELEKIKTSNNGMVLARTYNDLMYIGKHNSEVLMNEKVAQNYYIKAMETSDITDENKAIAQIYLGLSQINDDNAAIGIRNAEEGCKTIQKLVQKNKINNQDSSMVATVACIRLGDIYYKDRSEYKEAAVCYERALDLAERENLLSNMEEEKANKLYSKVAAAYYKAQSTIKTNSDYANNSLEYQKAEHYFGEYLKRLTNGLFSYSSLNDSFVKSVVNSNKSSSSTKIATALEMLGVVSTKNRDFQIAFNCFKTSYDIRKIVQGRKVDLANDLLALGRLSMVSGYEDLGTSKVYLEEACEILEKELGINHPNAQKERAFINEYFGMNFASMGKYLYKGTENAKNTVVRQFIGEDNDAVNKWEKEIIDDFHLIYKDLNICE